MNAGEAVTLLSGKRTFTTKADLAKKKHKKKKQNKKKRTKQKKNKQTKMKALDEVPYTLGFSYYIFKCIP